MSWVVTGVSLVWLALVVRQNNQLHALLKKQAGEYEALALKSQVFQKGVDKDIETIVDLYEGALDRYRSTAK